MKKIIDVFKSIRLLNCNKPKNESEQLKKQIDILDKLISTFQIEKESNDHPLISELDTIRYSIEQQSKKLESITEKIDKLDSDVNIPKSKCRANIIVTVVAILFIFVIMVIKVTDIVLSQHMIIIIKIAEAIICAELILHTGLLSKYDKNKHYFWASRIIYILMIPVPALIIRYTQANYFEINNCWLSCANTILSSAAFIVTFLGNLSD